MTHKTIYNLLLLTASFFLSLGLANTVFGIKFQNIIKNDTALIKKQISHLEEKTKKLQALKLETNNIYFSSREYISLITGENGSGILEKKEYREARYIEILKENASDLKEEFPSFKHTFDEYTKSYEKLQELTTYDFNNNPQFVLDEKTRTINPVDIKFKKPPLYVPNLLEQFIDAVSQSMIWFIVLFLFLVSLIPQERRDAK